MNDKIYTRNRWRLPATPPKFRSPKAKKEKKKMLKIFAILIIAFTFAYFSLQAIKPIIEMQCKNKAKSIATKICNNEATKVMKNYTYEDLVKVSKDGDGNVKMASTNMITVNEIISAIPVNIQEEMEKSQNNTFSIRLGSFLGSNLFAGRGPRVNIKIEMVGNLDTELKSEFTSCGINQTLHNIYLEVICHVIILTPYNTMEEKIINQVLLAESIIVGEVPSSYYNLEGMTRDNMLDVIE